jgi:uncharacterized protein YciI
MLFVVICNDRPGVQELRQQNRVAHLDFLRLNANRIKACGPFVGDDGTTMTGSMLIIEGDDRGAVEALMAREPYNKAGLFEAIEYRPWRWVIGAPVK